jgi:hypothetical protein
MARPPWFVVIRGEADASEELAELGLAFDAGGDVAAELFRGVVDNFDFGREGAESSAGLLDGLPDSLEGLGKGRPSAS